MRYYTDNDRPTSTEPAEFLLIGQHPVRKTCIYHSNDNPYRREMLGRFRLPSMLTRSGWQNPFVGIFTGSIITMASEKASIAYNSKLNISFLIIH